MMKKANVLSACVLGVTALLGCAPAPSVVQPAGSVQDVEVINPSALPAARGETSLSIKTMVGSGSGSREAFGANCVAETAYSRVEFTTPARIGLPDLGPETPPAKITCNAGAQSGTVTVRPFLQNRSRSRSVYPSVGVSVGTGGYSGVGVSFGGLWTAAPQTSANGLAATYPDVQVYLQ